MVPFALALQSPHHSFAQQPPGLYLIQRVPEQVIRKFGKASKWLLASALFGLLGGHSGSTLVQP
jgi:hypothetical protein